ncbi:RecQ-mediated genome instability protein 1 [Hypsizygus marmoreus]|uniref:RecQ-mediated genome instability protein 1 n=1 Tax=Hypsizygus marmoreus TaxID=39966 RepID=A0A369JYL2_HYPMA|nr:RecQ-mediated genome instability protein 1 [Hypsizygus marmoreus]
MPVPPRVVDWVDRKYKRPRVDPEWLNDCYAWLTTEAGHNPDVNFQGLVDAIEHQILESNLCDSMLPGTGLPTHVALPDTTTTLRGILVEVASITEIAHSAFNLNQTRMAIEERIKDGNVDEGEGEGDIEVEGEGPMPKYPRGMLKFHLTDGTTTLPAIEYRSFPELCLDDMPLGYKMFLKDVHVRRGIAFLEPKTVVLLGHKTDDRDENRQTDFARALRFRMGLPEPPPPPENNLPVPNNAVPPAAQPIQPQQARNRSRDVVRSPLHEISLPPSPPHDPFENDDENLEPRRRRIPNRVPDLTASTSSMLVHTGQATNSGRRTENTSSYFATAVASGSGSRTAPAGSKSSISTTIDLVLSPHRRVGQPLFLGSPPPSPGPEDEHFWSDDELVDHDAENRRPGLSEAQRASLSGEDRFIFDFGHSAVRFIEEVKATSANEQNKGKGKHKASNTNGIGAYASSDDFGDDDFMFDNDALEAIDAVEQEAYAGRSRVVTVPPSSTVGASSGASARSQSSAVATNNDVAHPEVITIDDDDSDDGGGEDKALYLHHPLGMSGDESTTWEEV